MWERFEYDIDSKEVKYVYLASGIIERFKIIWGYISQYLTALELGKKLGISLPERMNIA